MTQEQIANGLAAQGVLFATLAVVFMFVFMARADRGWQQREKAKPLAIIAYAFLGLSAVSILAAVWVGVSA